MNAVDEALSKQGLKSLADLARLLKEKDSAAFSQTKPRSLGVYLGKLRNGDSQWWRGKPECARALADLAGLDVRELGLTQPASDQTVLFAEFRGLPPVDPGSERLADISVDTAIKGFDPFNASHWLEPSGWHGPRPEAGLYWLEVPAGNGLDVLCLRVESSKDVPLLRRSRLSAPLPRDAHLELCVLRIEEPASSSDLIELLEAGVRAPVLVVCRHPPPDLPQGSERDGVIKAVNPDAGGSQLRGAMRRGLRADWHEVLAQWVVRRLDKQDLETHFDPGEVSRLLEEVSVWRNAINSPRELIMLCARLHERTRIQSRRYSLPGGGRALLEDCCEAHVEVGSVCSLLTRHFLSGAGPWGESQTFGTWSLLAGVEIDRPEVLDDKLLRLEEADDRAARKEIRVDLQAQFRAATLRHLIGRGGLKRNEDGSYAIDLPLAAQLVAADAALVLLRRNDPGEWVRVYLDPSRRFALEIAAGWMTSSELTDLVQSVLDFEADTLDQVAAEEFAFWTIGIRLASSKSLRLGEPHGIDQTQLDRLATRVVERLPASDPAPWTRALDEENEDIAWVTVCWAWSIAIFQPNAVSMDPHSIAWLFPGWIEPHVLSSIGGAPCVVDGAIGHTPQGPLPTVDVWRTWWKVAARVVDAITEPPKYHPAALTPLMTLRATQREWKVPGTWLESTAMCPVAERLMRPEVAKLRTHARQGLLVALGHHWATSPKLNYKVLLPRSWLARELTDPSGLDALIPAVGPSVARHFLEWGGGLDSDSARVLLNATPCNTEHLEDFLGLLPHLDESAINVVEPWLDELSTGYRAAAWIWENAPSTAMQMIERSEDSSSHRLGCLLECAPYSEQKRVAQWVFASGPDEVIRLSAPEITKWFRSNPSRLRGLLDDLVSRSSIHVDHHQPPSRN